MDVKEACNCEQPDDVSEIERKEAGPQKTKLKQGQEGDNSIDKALIQVVNLMIKCNFYHY